MRNPIVAEVQLDLANRVPALAPETDAIVLAGDRTETPDRD